MKSLPFLVATVASAISLILGVWLFFLSATNQGISNTIQQRQQEVQTQQQALSIKQQTLQAQQDQINQGNTISQQVGPAVLKDMAERSVTNEKIKKILNSHGYNVEVKDDAKAPAAAPKSATP